MFSQIYLFLSSNTRHLIIAISTLVVIAIIFMGSLFVHSLEETNSAFKHFSEIELLESKHVSQLQLALLESHNDIRQLFVGDRNKEEEIYEKGIVILDKLYNVKKNAESFIDEGILSEDERLLYLALVEHIDAYIEKSIWAVDTTSVNPDDYEHVLHILDEVLVNVTTILSSLQENIINESVEDFDDLRQLTEKNFTIYIPVAIGIILFIFLLTIIYYRLTEKYANIIKEKNNSLTKKVHEKTNELTEAYNKLKLSEQVKLQFLSRMSHELRTPMNAIIGFSELLLLENKISDHEKKYVNEVKDAGNELLNMVNNILSFQESGEDKLERMLVKVNLSKIINKCVNDLDKDANSKNIKIHAEVDKDLNVMAEEHFMQVVIGNIIDNAIKYNHNNGSIYINCEKGSESTTIKIKDDGVGIKKENINKIFDPFFMVDTKSTITKGTGVGLSLCSNIIESMQGKIEVESIENEGSTFIVYIPNA